MDYDEIFHSNETFRRYLWVWSDYQMNRRVRIDYQMKLLSQSGLPDVIVESKWTTRCNVWVGGDCVENLRVGSDYQMKSSRRNWFTEEMRSCCCYRGGGAQVGRGMMYHPVGRKEIVARQYCGWWRPEWDDVSMKGLHGEKIDTALVSAAWIGVERYDRKSSFESGERPEGEERCWVERKGRGQAWNQGCFGESKKLKWYERTVERSFQTKSELFCWKWKAKRQQTDIIVLHDIGIEKFGPAPWSKDSEDSCFARTLGRRCGLETAVNGIPYLLTVRAFCAEKLCDLFSSCSLPSKIYRFPCYAIPASGDRALVKCLLCWDWGLPYWRIGVCSKTLREVKGLNRPEPQRRSAKRPEAE